MFLDHLVHWVPDLDDAVARYRAIGFDPRPGGRHPGMGTCNAVCFGGGSYIELLAICDRQEARRGPLGPGMARIEALLAAGGGMTSFAVRVTSIRTAAAGLRERGIALTDPLPGHMAGQPGGWRTAVPRSGPVWSPFLVEYDTGATRRAGHWTIDHLVIATPRPEASARWLQRFLGASPTAGGRRLPLAGGDVAFDQGGAERVTLVALTGAKVPVGTVYGVGYGGA